LRYSPERKEAVLRKLLPPYNRSIAELSEEERISTATLYNWRTEARAKGRLLPATDREPEGWSSADKFNAVLESAALSEAELAEYCRRRGLYPEQIRAWRGACEQANDRAALEQANQSEALKAERKRSKTYQRELARKERALAEAAALLTLSKKARAIWGEAEDE
jgi:transposase-like protein